MMKRENEFLYLKFYNNLKEQILSGLIEPGDYLMSEADLCRNYGLSRNSVRRSLDQLAKENLIIKKVGQGTIVNPTLTVPSLPSRTLRLFAPIPDTFADLILPSLIKEFTDRYPGVDVKVHSLPNHLGYMESIKKNADMGVHPDLILLGDMQFSEIENPNAFIDMNDKLSASLYRIYPKLLNRFQIDQQIKAAPVMFATVHLAYNRQLFEQSGVPIPGKDWSMEAFLDAAKRLTQVDDTGIIRQYGFAIMPRTQRWSIIALQNGLKQVRNEDELAETVTMSLEFLQDLIYRRRWAVLYHKPFAKNPFYYGKAAMVLTTGYEISHWNDEHIQFEIGYAPLPFGPVNATLLRSNGFMIPETSRETDLAKSFIETALDPVVQAKICQGTPFLSVIKPVNEAIHSETYLSSVNVLEHHMSNNFFESELFSSLHQANNLDDDMDLYWLGLEEPADLAPLFFQLYNEGNDK